MIENKHELAVVISADLLLQGTMKLKLTEASGIQKVAGEKLNGRKGFINFINVKQNIYTSH